MKKGFTLLELLIVVVILGILSLIAAPILLNSATKARDGAVSANVNAAASSVTSQFAVNTNDVASTVATTVVDLLNAKGAKNPVDNSANPFVDGDKGAKGQVTIDGKTTATQVVITGYDHAGNAITTKTIVNPNS